MLSPALRLDALLWHDPSPFVSITRSARVRSGGTASRSLCVSDSLAGRSNLLVICEMSRASCRRYEILFVGDGNRGASLSFCDGGTSGNLRCIDIDIVAVAATIAPPKICDPQRVGMRG
jgi:hypothetical protein